MSIEEIKEISIKAVHEADIKALYTLVEERFEEMDDEIEQGIYGNILDLALELLTNALESKSTLSLEKENEFYTLRALYEYAISTYSAKSFDEAKALFEVLESINDDEEFVSSMQIHAAAAKKSIDLNQFLDEYCVIGEKLDHFFIQTFTKEAQELL